MKKLHPYLSITVVCLSLLALYFRGKWEDQNYPVLSAIESELSGKVEKLYFSISNKGTYLVKLNRGGNFRFLASNTYNYEYSPHSLYDLIAIGDSIYKPKNTDSIYVFRNKSRYYFIAGEKINKRK